MHLVIFCFLYENRNNIVRALFQRVGNNYVFENNILSEQYTVLKVELFFKVG